MKKLFLAFAAMVMAFSVSAAELNIYASGLKAGTLADGKLPIEYVLNATATSLDFQVLNADGVAVKTIALEGDLLAKGAHSTTIDLSEVGAGTYTWALKASAEARTAMSADLITPCPPELAFYQPRDLAADMNPESPYFGNLYLANARQGTPTGVANASNTVSGVHVIDPLLTRKGSYDGGVEWAGKTANENKNGYGAYRIQVDEAGFVYVSEGKSGSSAVYVMDPANPSANFTPVLALDKRGTTFTTIRGFDVIGSGEDRKLVTLDGIGYSGGCVGNVYSYAIGNTINYTEAPTTIVAASAINLGNGLNSIESDGRGGWWISQNRSNDGGLSCLFHVNATTLKKDFASNTASLGLSNNVYALVSANKDNSLIAVGNNANNFIVYDVAWDENGTPTLTKKCEVALGRAASAVAFDYANNLYVGSHSSERLYAYALPSSNVQTTPAQAKYGFTIEAKAGDVLATGIVINEGSAKTVEKGESFTLTATATPDNHTSPIAWSTSDDKVATVENGLVKAVGPGEATITASCDAQVATFTVTVKKPVVTIAGAAEITLAKGETLQLSATLAPADDAATILWSSSDASNVSVSAEGLLTAVSAGSATITAKTADSEEATIFVTVPAVPLAAGTYKVGGEGADYASLYDACYDLNENGVLGDVTLAICADLIETKNSGIINTSEHTISIRPDGETLRTITFQYSVTYKVTGSIIIGAQDPVNTATTVATKNVIIDGCAEGSDVPALAIVHDNLGGSLRIAAGSSNNAIKNLHISYGEHSSGNRYPIWSQGGDITIAGNTIIGNGASRVIQLETNGNTLIEGNTLEFAGLAAASPAYGLHGGSAVNGNVIVRNNKFTKVTTNLAADQGIAAVSCQGGTWLIENNYFAGMDFLNTTEGTKARMDYIRIAVINTVTIRHNTFYIPSFTNKPANADNKVNAIESNVNGVVVSNNIFVSAEETAQHTFFYGNALTLANNVFQTVAENAKAYISGTQTLAAYLEANATAKTATVKFVDAAAGDLALAEGGDDLLVPAIADVATDINGTARGAETTYAGAFEYVAPAPADKYIVAGVEALCGSTWSADDENNLMTEGEGGIYTKVYTNVPAGKGYLLKVVKNGSNWYGDATGNNVTFEVVQVCDVTVTFDPATSTVTVTGEHVSFVTRLEIEAIYAVGNGGDYWLNGATWNPGAEANKMQEVSPYVYQITYAGVPAGSYEVKFVANGTWVDTWGGGDYTITESVKDKDIYHNGNNIVVSHSFENADITLELNLVDFDYPTKAGAKFSVTIADKSDATALENAAAEQEVRKVIENGQLIIIKDGVRYNVQGVRL